MLAPIWTFISRLWRKPSPTQAPAPAPEVKPNATFGDVWETVKQALNPTSDPKLDILLENTRRNIFDRTSDGNVAFLSKVTLPVLAQWYRYLTIGELIGIQPISGPVDKILADETDYTVDPPVTTTMEETVEAKSRKLSARWYLEPVNSSRAAQGTDVETDVEAEILAALAQETVCEYEVEILACLREDAKQLADIDPTSLAAGIDAALAGTGKHGPVTWMVISPKLLPFLSADSRFSLDNLQGTALKRVGYFNQIAVYVDQFAKNEGVLFGVKNGETGVGMVLAPYIPLLTPGVVIDPVTFEPVISFMTRYGLYCQPDMDDWYTWLPVTLPEVDATGE